MIVKRVLTPPSPEAVQEVLRVIAASPEPLPVASIVKLLLAPNDIPAGQLQSVLDRYVTDGDLKVVPAATAAGKPRYWDRDVSVELRKAVTNALAQFELPTTAKVLAGKITAPVKPTENEVTAILTELVSEGTAYVLPGASEKDATRYWSQDFSLEMRKAVATALAQFDLPTTAKVLAGKITSPFKVTESDVTPILADLVKEGAAYLKPAASEKDAARYWNQDFSVEIRKSVVAALGQFDAPVAAKALAGKITSPIKVTENDVTPILTDLVNTGTAYVLPATSEKDAARYWHQDFSELAEAAILEAFKNAPGPLTAKELAAQIVFAFKLKETDLTPILTQLVDAGNLRAIPGAAKKPTSYWDQDPTAIGREAALDVLQKSDAPLLAKDVAAKITSAVKFTEIGLTPILEQLVDEGELHVFPGTSAKAKPRFWNRDLLYVARNTVLQFLDAKGAQAEANLKKAAKGLTDEQFQTLFQELLDTGAILRHPPLSSTKPGLFGTRPPVLGPYLKDVEKQLTKVVATLREAQIPDADLRQACLQLLESAGIVFGTTSKPDVAESVVQTQNTTHTTEIDLIDLMKQIEPGAERGALVAARELRRAAKLGKAQFDTAALDLAREGKLSLHRHDHVNSLTQEERDELVTDGTGTYYIGMVIRKDAI
jgi:DNA-binding MarR family transcriptional regulator